MTRVLLVEDDPDIRMIAAMSLEAVGGFEVTACDSGVSALKAVQQLSPDVILLDAVMPSMDGPTTLLALSRMPSTSRTPAIFLTANYQSLDMARCRSLGAIGVIHKPFDPMTLPTEIRTLMESQP